MVVDIKSLTYELDKLREESMIKGTAYYGDVFVYWFYSEKPIIIENIALGDGIIVYTNSAWYEAFIAANFCDLKKANFRELTGNYWRNEDENINEEASD